MRSKWMRMLVAAVAVLALAAVAAAGASAALPEMKFSSWPDNYSGKSGEVTLEAKSGATVKCLASTNSGEVTTSKTFAKVQLKYTGCKEGTGSNTCSNKSSGEIVTSVLKSELVYINKASKEVGQVFKPEVAGSAFAKFECAGTLGAVTLSGGVIAKLPSEQVNKFQTSFTWNYRQTKGVQEPTEYEEGSTKVSIFLTGIPNLFKLEQTGEAMTETMTWAKSAEIAA